MPEFAYSSRRGFSRRSLAAIFLAGGVWASAATAGAQTVFTWDGGPDSSYDGTWINPLNWTADFGSPTALDTARFNANQSFTVSMGGASVSNLDVTSGDVRFDFLPGSRLTTNSGVAVRNATMRIRNGTVGSESAVLETTNAAIFLDGSTLQFQRILNRGTLLIEGNGHIAASFGSPNLSVDSTLPGPLTIRAVGGNLDITMDRQYGTLIPGSVELGPNSMRIFSERISGFSFGHGIESSVSMAGGVLETTESLSLLGRIFGHGTVRVSGPGAILSIGGGAELDGNLLLDLSSSPEFYSLTIRGPVDVGPHRFEVRGATVDNLPVTVWSSTSESSSGVRIPTVFTLAGGELMLGRSALFVGHQNFESGPDVRASVQGYGVIRGKLFAELTDLRGDILPDNNVVSRPDPWTWFQATGPLVLANRLEVGGDPVGLLSSAPVSALQGVTIAGGTLRTPAGLTVPAGQTVSGYGLIRGPVLPGTTLVGTHTFQIGDDILFGSDEWTFLSSGTVEANRALDLAGAALRTPGILDLKAASSLRGFGSVEAELVGSGPVSLENGNLTLGRATSTQGINLAGTVSVGPHTLTLRDADAAVLGGNVTLGGGTILAANGLRLTSALTGNGTVTAALTGNGTITATGDLVLGDATQAVGVNFDGTLNVATHRVTLLSGSAPAALGPSTTLAGGLLVSATGFNVASGETISGSGILLGALGGVGAGTALSPGGPFTWARPLAVGNATATLLTTGQATVSDLTTLAGGTVNGPTGAGLRLAGGGAFSGFGTMNVPLDATAGNVTVGGGALNLAAGGTFDATTTVGAGSTLQLSGGASRFLSGSQSDLAALAVTGGAAGVEIGATFAANAVTVSGGSLTFAAGTTGSLATASPLTVSGTGTLTLNADTVLPIPTTVSGNGTATGTLNGTGALRIDSGRTLRLERGALTGGGLVDVRPGGTLDIVTNTATLSRSIVNAGTVRLNPTVAENFFLGGSATLENLAGGTVRFLETPVVSVSQNLNSIRASGLDVINRGTMTVGALTAQTGSAAQPWFYLDRSLTNTGTLALLQSADVNVFGAFNHSGSLTLANDAFLVAHAGGTSTGTAVLGTLPGAFLAFRGAAVHDAGTTFSGAGYLSVEGGSLTTPAGTYVPTVNLELLGGATLPAATGLAVGSGRWLRVAGPISALPITVPSGGDLQFVGGTNTNAIMIATGGTARIGSTYATSIGYVRDQPATVLNAVAGTPGRGDIVNAGTVEVVPGRIAGTGRLINEPGGVSRAVSGFSQTLQEMMLETVNRGLLMLHTVDDDPNLFHSAEYVGGVRFGNIANTGTVSLRATEASHDAHDDVSVRMGTFTQTAGTTTIETTRWNSGIMPDAFIQADAFNILGGSVSATGRLVVPVVANQGLFQVGSAGLAVSGGFSNQSGGELRLSGRLTLGGPLTLGTNARLLLDGPAADVFVGGASVFGSAFNTPAGSTVELRNRTLNTPATMTTEGTLIVGAGGVLERWSGALAGGGTVRVSSGGHLNLYHDFNGSGTGPIEIESGGRLTLNGSSQPVRLHGRPLANRGTVDHVLGAVLMNGSTVITNHGVWNDSSTAAGANFAFSNEGGQTPGGQFINHGTLNKSGTGTLSFGGPANGPWLFNSGTINLNAGSIAVASGVTFAGTSVVNLAAGTTLQIHGDGATSQVESGARFQGAGTLGFGTGAHTLNGDIHASNVSFGGVLLGNHTLHGNWSVGFGATLATAGTTRIASDGTWNFNGHVNGVNRLYGRTFVNDGTVNHNESALGLDAAASITNRGTWNTSAHASLTTEGGYTAGGVFRNEGTLNKSGSGTLTFGGNGTGPTLVNSGTINLAAGSISVGSAVTFTGTSVVNLAAGTTFGIGSDGATSQFQNGARFQGAGTLGLGAGAHTLNGDIHASNASFGGGVLLGNHTLHGNWTMAFGATLGAAGTTRIASDGVWNFNGHVNSVHRLHGRTFINDGIVNHNESALGFDAATVVTNRGTWNYNSNDNFGFTGTGGDVPLGAFVNEGTFVKYGAGTLEMNYYHGPRFSNTGTVDVRQGTLELYRNLVQHDGSTLAGGTWIVRAGARLSEGYMGAYTVNRAHVTLYGNAAFGNLAGSLLRNEGTLRLLDGHVLAAGSGAFTNTGTLLVGAGSRFTAAGGITNSGTLGGAGAIVGSIVSSGILAPGESPGLLAVTGNLTLQGTSQLLLELGGAGRGTGYDAIDVSGTFNFGGTLVLSLVNGYAPAAGTSFDLFNFAAGQGSFQQLTLPTLAGGLQWNTGALYSAGVLSVQASAIPEPSTYALFAGAAMLAAALVRRRRSARN